MSTSSNARASGSAPETEADTGEKEATRRNTFPDRLLADALALDRLRAWSEQAAAYFQGGIKPTRNDIANALLLSHEEALSAEELSFLWKRCFNPVRFLKSTVAQLQEAEARGEAVTLDQVMDRIKRSVAEPACDHPAPRRRKRGIRAASALTSASDGAASQSEV